MTKQFRILALAGNGMEPSTTAGKWLVGTWVRRLVVGG